MTPSASIWALALPRQDDSSARPPVTNEPNILVASAATSHTDRDLIASTLLDEAARRGWIAPPATPPAIAHDPLGAPFFKGRPTLDPAISFTRAQGYTWGALSMGTRLGVDAASDREFSDPYPVNRAFAPGELEHLRTFAPKGIDETGLRALAWSAKEATAKALGTAFHRTDFRSLTSTLQRASATAAIARAFRQPWGWLSLAVLTRPIPGACSVFISVEEPIHAAG